MEPYVGVAWLLAAERVFCPPSADDAESREPAGYGNPAFARLNKGELVRRGRDFRRFVSATATKTSQT